MRWSEAQMRDFHRAGIWRGEGMEALAAARAAAGPDRLAFADETEQLTWAQCDERLRAVAAGLQDAGVTPGDVVALRLTNSVEHVVALLAIAAVGAVAFELFPDATPAQVAHGLALTGAVGLLTETPATQLELDALRGPRLIARPAELGGDPDSQLPGSDPDAVALLLGTSGTTGTPKIAMRTANASLAMARHVTSRTHVGAGDTVVLGAPLAGGIGYFNGLCTALEHGCPVILARNLAPAGLFALIEAHQATVLQTVPTILRRMAQAPEGERADTASLRLVQSGGSYLHASTASMIETRFGCRVISAYGAVDVGTVTMADPLHDTAEQRWETVGRPYDDPLCELAILDEAGDPVAVGETGEVAMRGPNTSLGYFEDETATAALFDERGWGHLGDLGHIGPDGRLRIVGRVKEIINRGGHKLSIEEIEGYVRGFPGLRDIAAVGYDDPDLGERCAAVVVCEPWLHLRLDQLRAYLSQRGVPRPVWPERVEQIDELPLSPQGKVRRRELREMIAG